ncbi:hypothetical protein CKO25_06485 [Thiocapsa imhoffii]|uniref:Uncharacterized protein n=1 Tax=Thiocapsa imhoffii TaxID=382777 RepID=A0A9X0WGM5_9GAMM|nr:hypothetical protein [Thiocapsa imhoffii]
MMVSTAADRVRGLAWRHPVVGPSVVWLPGLRDRLTHRGSLALESLRCLSLDQPDATPERRERGHCRSGRARAAGDSGAGILAEARSAGWRGAAVGLR